MAIVSWQGAKYAEDLWMAWTDAADKIAATSPQLDAFSASISNMGAKSKFTMNELAQVSRIAADNLLNEKQTLEAVAAAMDLSTGRGGSLSAATEVISKAMRIFKDDSLSAAKAADILTRAELSAGVQADDLQSAFSMIAPITKKLGWDFADLVGLLGTLKIHGADSGRSIMQLSGLLKDISEPTSNLGKEMSKAGVAIDITGGHTADLISLLKSMKNAGIDVDKIIDSLGTRVGPQLAEAMKEGGSAVKALTDQLNSADGIAKKMSSTFEMTFGGAFSYLMARFKDFPTRLSMFLSGSLTSLFTPLQKGLGSIYTAIENSGLAKKLDAVLKPVFSQLGTWISSILSKWSEFISKITSKDIENAVNRIKIKFKELSDWIREVFSGVDFKSLAKGLLEALASVINIGKSMAVAFAKLPEWQKNIVLITGAFVALGGASIVAGILSVVGAVGQLTTAILGLNAAKAAGGAAAVAGAGAGTAVPMGVAAGGAIAAGMYGLNEAKKGPMGLLAAPATLMMTAISGAKGGVSAATSMINKSSGNEDLTKSFEKGINNTGELEKEAEATRKELKEKSEQFMNLFGDTTGKIVESNNDIISLMTELANKVVTLQSNLDSINNRIAALSLSQKSRTSGI